MRNLAFKIARNKNKNVVENARLGVDEALAISASHVNHKQCARNGVPFSDLLRVLVCCMLENPPCRT